MKRREFLRTAGAAAILPVMPLPAAAVPAAAAPSSVTAINAMQVGWAALYARVNNRATPALLQKWLRVGPDQAQALMSELVSRNIVHAPLAGSAAAVNPMYPQGGFPGMFQKSRKVLDTARDVLDALADEDQESAIYEGPDPVTDHEDTAATGISPEHEAS